MAIQRVAVGDRSKAEARAVSQREVLVNGIAPGETSLIVWQEGGNRLLFDLRVLPSPAKLDAVRRELQRALPNQDITLNLEDGSVFVQGTAKDLSSAELAVEIAKTLGNGRPVNLLRVNVPQAEQQILLKVKFAQVDRSYSQQLGANIFSLGALNTIGSISTGQFSQPIITTTERNVLLSLPDMLNIFMLRPDLNIGSTVKLLQSKGLLEILSEPNVMGVNGKEASLLAGGEFPFPVVQMGSGGAPVITLMWREFGVKLNFTPTLTPLGTIRLKVKPEVSSLDFNNAALISGFRIPALATRRVQTEVELQDNQTFAIAGLLDNHAIETLVKMPGLASIPLLGKLFQSREITKGTTELLILVTPEIVRPIPAGMAPPEVKMPVPFVQGSATVAPRTPPISVTGDVPVKTTQDTLPFEQLKALKEPAAPPTAPMLQLLPLMVAPQTPGVETPTVAPPAPATK